MQAVNALTAAPAPEPSKSCGVSRASPSRLNRRMMIALCVAATLGLTALGLGQNWLSIAGLLPFLYVLPCAAMMLMCMKGMNRGPQAGTGSANSPTIDASKQASDA